MIFILDKLINVKKIISACADAIKLHTFALNR